MQEWAGSHLALGTCGMGGTCVPSPAMVFSVQKLGQEARPSGLLPHATLFLGGLSISGNILKGRGEEVKAWTWPELLASEGFYWILYQESQLVPRNSTMGRARPGVLVTPDRGHCRSSSLES